MVFELFLVFSAIPDDIMDIGRVADEDKDSNPDRVSLNKFMWSINVFTLSSNIMIVCLLSGSHNSDTITEWLMNVNFLIQKMKKAIIVEIELTIVTFLEKLNKEKSPPRLVSVKKYHYLS